VRGQRRTAREAQSALRRADSKRFTGHYLNPSVTYDYPFQTREVRDLAWACFAPPLLLTRALDTTGTVHNCPLALTRERFAWLETLDRDATLLLDHLAQRRDRRLGLYFERLWHFFLAQDPATDLIAHNLPVQQDGRTLGEFDCLYYCRERERHVHLELAVKFYLGHHTTLPGHQPGDLSDWLGPNARDRLDLKVSHLLARQSRLAETTAAQELLDHLGIDAVQREIEVKGWLFQPRGNTLPAPDAHNPCRSMGKWLLVSDLPAFLVACNAVAYRMLPRLQWLSSAAPDPSAEMLTPTQLELTLRDTFERGARPRLVAALNASGFEIQRFFVVGPGWPVE
jgi:hypothetical protein